MHLIVQLMIHLTGVQLFTKLKQVDVGMIQPGMCPCDDDIPIMTSPMVDMFTCR